MKTVFESMKFVEDIDNPHEFEGVAIADGDTIGFTIKCHCCNERLFAVLPPDSDDFSALGAQHYHDIADFLDQLNGEK